jgi:hypothetical protein
MGVRELLARAWGLTSWEPSEEHADDLELAATLDKMERLLCVGGRTRGMARGGCCPAPPNRR